MNPPERPITILIAALGGEGGGVMADWLMEAATATGYPAQATSIPGVAQPVGEDATAFAAQRGDEDGDGLRIVQSVGQSRC